MNKKDKLLTIGQFAAMHGINKKTLMWYDEIGLFKPTVINPENGYRCYNYHQSPILETILLLRELDVSINEIQDFMKNRSACSLHKASYGSMLSVTDLLNGSFDNYSRLFIEIPFLPYQTGQHIMPKGKYLRAFHKGEWGGIPKRYREILDYAREHGLTFHGFSYETGINENVIDRIEDYIVQIEIPVTE